MLRKCHKASNVIRRDSDSADREKATRRAAIANSSSTAVREALPECRGRTPATARVPTNVIYDLAPSSELISRRSRDADERRRAATGD
jgi:hypothetical protein